MANTNTDKEKFWREQMARAEKFDGSLDLFCKANNLSIHCAQYWRSKFRSEASAKSLAKFASVELTGPEVVDMALPNAKWLAELILHLQAGVR